MARIIPLPERVPRRRPLRAPGAAVRETVGVAGRAGRAGRRWFHEVVRRGAHGASITTGPDRTVLLFYADIEGDRWLRGDRWVRRGLRHLYHAVTVGQRVSGFEIAFRLLVRALERRGCRVVVNNATLARRYPEHPVGICGYPHVLERWRLPNPAVLGPGLLDHPAQLPRLMDDTRFRTYLVPCGWMYDLFAPWYGGPRADRVQLWYAGIDLDEWPDLTGAPKDVDVLVYDKIRWHRDRYAPSLLEPALAMLRRRGLRVHVLARGGYETGEYRALLGRSRAMLFLCEYEAQGLAYQEAMACGVPVLAWDPEEWTDPRRPEWAAAPVRASSVPYFAPECGERFPGIEEFGAALDRLLGGMVEGRYDPRGYVRRALSVEGSAVRYLDAYVAAGR